MDSYKWLWSKISEKQKIKILTKAVTSADQKTIKCLIAEIDDSGLRDLVLDLAIPSAGPEMLMWLWETIAIPEYRAKILEAAVIQKDSEILVWFWKHAETDDQRGLILANAIPQANLETIKWFWKSIRSEEQRGLIFTLACMSTNMEVLAWLWKKFSNKDRRIQLFAVLLSHIDATGLKWFWDNADDDDQRAEIFGASLKLDDFGFIASLLNSADTEERRDAVFQKVSDLILSDNLGTVKHGAKMPCGRVKFEYDIALSFAGEDRQHAERLAELLRVGGSSVFYDKYDQADLWGKDLYQHLQSVYRDKARYCVMFLSKSYAQRLWTRHELKQAQARAFRESEEYILPIKIDDTEIPGINDTVGYIDLRDTSLAGIADLLVKKLVPKQRRPDM